MGSDGRAGSLGGILEHGISRRDLLKTLGAAGLLAALPGGVLKAASAAELPPPDFGRTVYLGKAAYQTFRNACPRNCYDTCGIVSYVKDGVLQFVEGAPESTYTKGGLCVKGYAYPRTVYSPDRIKYPMKQAGRGSGKWQRISWDEAMDTIAEKLLQINRQDGSMLGLGMTKYSGNFGITHYGVDGLMTSLGYTTRFIGTPCWPAGIDAQNYDMGNMWCNDPEDLVQSRYIIIWGANPAYCSIHSLKFIYEAQRRGAKVVVIDPVFTQTAAKADEYWEVKPGSDGALALGMARYLIDEGLIDRDWVTQNTVGFPEYDAYLKSSVTLEWAAQQAGLPVEVVKRVAEEFAAARPSTIWIGYGLQRHTNGGQNVRAIDSLVALTGNIGKAGGGARYGHLQTWGFNYFAMSQKPPEGAKGVIGPTGPKGEFDRGGAAKTTYTDRTVNINKIAQEILDAQDPPVRVLWIANKNVVSQDFDRAKILKAFQKLELIVAVDLFYNQTVEQVDIVLPTVTPFEDWTVNVSYWHYWMNLNEQAVTPLFEAKSDNEIGVLLSAKMNKLQPGSCTFPTAIDSKDWMVKEFGDTIYKQFGISSWEELRQGPKRAQLASPAAWADLQFATPSKKYEFSSSTAEKYKQTALPVYKEGRKPTAPFRLLTPHHKYGLHSQFQNLDWMLDYNAEPFVYVHPSTANTKGIANGDWVRVFNKTGEQKVRARLTTNVPADTLLMYEAWFGAKNGFNVNNMVDDTSSDMGVFKTGSAGVAIHDQFADIAKA